MKNQRITTAIIGDQGYTTRRLPFSSTIPKGFTPIGNRPVIDFIIDDLVEAGVEDIYFVIHTYHRDIYERYFLGNDLLDHYLEGKGKTAQLLALRKLRERARFHFVDRIDERYGTTTAPLRVFEEIGRFQPCIYLQSDDFTVRDDGGNDLKDLIKYYEDHSGAVGALTGYELPIELLSNVGVMQVEDKNGVCVLKSLIEKPKHPEKLKGPLLANIGKHIIGAEMESYFKDPKPNPELGEYYVVDLYNEAAEAGDKVLVYPAKGSYFDVGTVENWLVANAKLAED